MLLREVFTNSEGAGFFYSLGKKIIRYGICNFLWELLVQGYAATIYLIPD